MEILRDLATQAQAWELRAGTDLHRRPEGLVEVLEKAER